MPEIRPISERIDLTYVRKRRWPHTLIYPLTFGLVAVLLLAAAGGELTARVEGIYAHAFYSSGTLTKAHAMFGSDCGACHRAAVGDREATAFFLPVLDDACIACHESVSATHHPHQSRFQGGTRTLGGLAEPVLMAGNCAACHIEHRGRDHDLTRLDDGVCVSCHADLKGKGFAANRPVDAQAPSSHNQPIRLDRKEGGK